MLCICFLLDITIIKHIIIILTILFPIHSKFVFCNLEGKKFWIDVISWAFIKTHQFVMICHIYLGRIHSKLLHKMLKMSCHKAGHMLQKYLPLPKYSSFYHWMAETFCCSPRDIHYPVRLKAFWCLTFKHNSRNKCQGKSSWTKWQEVDSVGICIWAPLLVFVTDGIFVQVYRK